MRRRERVSAAVLFAATFIAVMFVGGAFRWVEAIVALVTALAVGAQVTSRRVFSRIPPLLVLLGAAAVLTALQLVPLPELLVRSLQTTGAGLRDDGAALAGTSPWRALSLDAPATLRSLAFFVILLGVAWVALRLAVSSTGRYFVLAMVAGVAGLVAIVVACHELVGATSLFGIYDPALEHPTVLGPLINTNHLGCLMAAGAAVALGLALHRRQRTWLRITWLAVFASCAAVAVATQSRGAALALLSGTLITIGVSVAQRFFGGERKARASFLTTSLPITVVVISAIIVIVYASAGGVTRELETTRLDEEVQSPKSKFAIWRAASSLIEETPWVGIGRGAFEAAATHSHPQAAYLSFSHVENEYIQAVVDWGIPGAILLGIAMIWVLSAGLRRWNDGALAAGAIGGVSAIALQSIVDFGIELVGLAIPLTLLLAALTNVPLRDVEDRKKLLARGKRVGQILTLAVAALVLSLDATKSIREDHEDLRDEKKLVFADLVPSMTRHPLDYYGYAVAAQILYRDHDPRAVSMLNHALRLHPSHPGLHHIAARVLLQTGLPEQAAIEYAAALRTTPAWRAMIAEIVKQMPGKYAALAIPIELPEFDSVVQILQESGASREVVTSWLSRVLAAKPGHVRACDHLYSFAIHARDLRAAEETSAKCVDHALDHESRIQLASMLLAQNRPADALRTVHDVESWQGRVDVRLSGWMIVCDVDIARAQWDNAKRCLRRLDVSGLVTETSRGQITSRLEKIEAQLRAQTPK